jgi:predicted DNA-binding transcriptional regulator YafY
VVQAVDGEGGAVLEFDVRAPDAFLRWLLPFGSQADLLEPADLRDALAGQRARVRALYR